MRVEPLGDQALLVEVGTTADDETRLRVHALRARLAEDPADGVIDVVVGLATVAVHYDPLRVRRNPDELPYAALAREMGRRIAGLGTVALAPGRLVEIPVCYDETVALDLAEVARHAGVTPDEVIALHSAGTYSVHMVGFLPGFPYLAGLDPRLATPRRSTPRVRVPAGSVAIGGSHTGIYPLESPGGWQIVGRTPATLFSTQREAPALLQIGDRVRFRAVSLEELALASSA